MGTEPQILRNAKEKQPGRTNKKTTTHWIEIILNKGLAIKGIICCTCSISEEDLLQKPIAMTFILFSETSLPPWRCFWTVWRLLSSRLGQEVHCYHQTLEQKQLHGNRKKINLITLKEMSLGVSRSRAVVLYVHEKWTYKIKGKSVSQQQQNEWIYVCPPPPLWYGFSKLFPMKKFSKHNRIISIGCTKEELLSNPMRRSNCPIRKWTITFFQNHM